MNDITVNLYADKYGEGNLVNSILAKNFGFELEFSSDKERSRRILTYKELVKLQDSISKALVSYHDANKHDFING